MALDDYIAKSKIGKGGRGGNGGRGRSRGTFDYFYLGEILRVLRCFSFISRILESILMEHKDKSHTVSHKLQISHICPVRNVPSF